MSTPTIVADMTGTSIPRGEVLAWEDGRITAVARKLGVSVPNGAVAMRRDTLLQAKLDLGSDTIAARLGREIRLSGAVARAAAAVSGKRRISAVDLYIDGGNAGQFVDFFERGSKTSDEPMMLQACPDHFAIRTRENGWQEVLETTGGSPLPSLFLIDYEDVSSLVTTPDPQFPHQIAGVARTAGGVAIGGVRHQFRDTDNGFHARLTVEFPLPSLGRMVSGHRWHLACEFSNWIEAASA